MEDKRMELVDYEAVMASKGHDRFDSGIHLKDEDIFEEGKSIETEWDDVEDSIIFGSTSDVRQFQDQLEPRFRILWYCTCCWCRNWEYFAGLLPKAANASTTFWLAYALLSLFEQLSLSAIIACTLPISLVELILRMCCGCCATFCISCFAATVGIRPPSKYIAGEIEVLLGREHVEDVSFNEFVRDINESDYGYCFLRVLNSEDRIQFVALLPDYLIVESYKRRAMRLRHWVAIMRQIPLTAKYVVYRRCYWGEHVGSKNILNRKTDFIVPVWIFRKSVYSNGEPGIWFGLIAMFQMLFSEEVNILVEENHMEVITHPFGRFTLSRWENKEFRLETNEYLQT